MDLGIYCIYPACCFIWKTESVKANAVMLESGVDGREVLILNMTNLKL